jgi:hypothetical protein
MAHNEKHRKRIEEEKRRRAKSAASLKRKRKQGGPGAGATAFVLRGQLPGGISQVERLVRQVNAASGVGGLSSGLPQRLNLDTRRRRAPTSGTVKFQTPKATPASRRKRRNIANNLADEVARRAPTPSGTTPIRGVSSAETRRRQTRSSNFSVVEPIIKDVISERSPEDFDKGAFQDRLKRRLTRKGFSLQGISFDPSFPVLP